MYNIGENLMKLDKKYVTYLSHLVFLWYNTE